MRLVTGQEFEVGITLEDLENLLEAHPGEELSLGRELGTAKGKRLPKIEVDAFYMQATEVTNEQYLAFVRATGSKPPFAWASKDIESAQIAYVEEQGRLRKEAIDAGQTPPTSKPFDPYDWFDSNWEDIEYDVPESIAGLPVVDVSFEQAEKYAAWAGLRLPTEYEFQAAAGRGLDKEARQFPWGAEWETGRAVTSEGESAREQPMRVASLPPQSESFGLYDLVGNVWEWTASPFLPLEGAPDGLTTLKLGKNREVTLRSTWDADKRIVVGGSFANDAFAARLTFRRPTSRSQQAAALGFRCAADEGVGLTRAVELSGSLPPPSRFDEDYAPEATVGRDRWATIEGSVDVPGYGIVVNYERALFIPLEKIPYAEVGGRSRSSMGNASLQDAPVPIGVLDMSLGAIEPELYPDSYVLAYRAPGTKREAGGGGGDDENETESSVRGQDEETVDPALEFVDTKVPSIVVYDVQGNPVAAFEIGEPQMISNRKREKKNEFAIRRWVEPKKVEEGEVLVPMDTLEFTIRIPSDKRGKDFEFTIPLKVAADSITESWR